MPSPPLVSIIVPCYRHEGFIRETIESVWAQTYRHVELIVIDDASPDRSASVIEEARDIREFVFLRNEVNRGLNATIERGLSVARGELVALLGSDDMILPDKLALQVEWMERHGLDGVLSTGFMLHGDGRREPIVLDRVARRFEQGTILRHVQTDDTEGALLQSGLFRAHVLRELAPLRRQFRSDDWAMAMQMLERFRIGFLNRPVFLYRQHGANAHRDYWRTFPMRVEVVSLLTPAHLRLEALANLCSSQASYLGQDGHPSAAFRFLAAAFVLDPRPARLWRPARNWVSTRLGRLRAAVRTALPGQR